MSTRYANRNNNIHDITVYARYLMSTRYAKRNNNTRYLGSTRYANRCILSTRYANQNNNINPDCITDTIDDRLCILNTLCLLDMPIKITTHHPELELDTSIKIAVSSPHRSKYQSKTIDENHQYFCLDSELLVA
jgi:hypothetical protein